ncbi:hypothetical protein ACP3VS_22860 [Lysinibacillus sp. VIII_CA]|uniref:hypothetical protein n=1 Tax=Lysinibacillus TaxID=400634 RepID=UPI0018CCB786|nr:hypothetical protein [Lysinibacillus sphaericus]MBG9692526.1 hypothetical protein [Lysinibacillus sphaericus]
MDNTSCEKVKTCNFKGSSFDLLLIKSENPGIDGYITVSGAPEEFGVNGFIFDDEDAILEVINENTSNTCK